MELVVRVPPDGDFFNYDSPCSSHYLTAPSTPLRFSISSVSAPTSPSHASNFYHDLNVDDDDVPIGSPSAVPFRWEEKPGIPKSPRVSNGGDFEFNLSGQLSDKASLSADELFDGGKIKPLKPPPGLFQVNDFSTKSNMSSSSSPRSPQYLKLSPRRKNEIDPFEAALVKETRSHSSNELCLEKRGRDRISFLTPSFVRKGTRSLSPFRASETVLDEDNDDNSLAAAAKAMSPITTTDSKSSTSSSSFLSSISFPKRNRKWRLRDLLFRSASEGRAEVKDDRLIRKYAVMSEKVDDDVTNSSFRSTDSSSSRGRGPVSAPEMHYTANRAVSGKLKKKTFLPYKQGLLGCLRFNRPAVHEISRGIGSLTRG